MPGFQDTRELLVYFLLFPIAHSVPSAELAVASQRPPGSKASPFKYGESALPIGAGQTISQPWIVGRMIELLELNGTEKVLEVGTGTGYQACVLSKVAARVFSIERINELALRAVELVRELRLHNVSVKVFDGTYGWSDQAPFDRIIVAATAPELPEPLVQQLGRGGTLVIPLGRSDNQRLARVRRVGTGIQIEDCGPASFVPLIGKFGWKDEEKAK